MLRVILVRLNTTPIARLTKSLVGVSLNVGALVGSSILAVFLQWYNTRENKKRARGDRDHRLDGLSESEIAALGSKHPRTFRCLVARIPG